MTTFNTDINSDPTAQIVQGSADAVPHLLSGVIDLSGGEETTQIVPDLTLEVAREARHPKRPRLFGRVGLLSHGIHEGPMPGRRNPYSAGE